jgi:Domain of unknown function (DUF4126)
METALGILIGIGLSAAAGLRIFVPLLVMSIAASSGHLNLAPGFEWIGTTPALIAFAAATVLEILAYLVPAVDHILDVLASPAAVVAGVVVAASTMVGISPFLQWTLALIAGGGIAGLMKGLSGVTRAKTAVTTAGFANPAVATAETGGAATLSILAVAFPAVAFLLVIGITIFAFKMLGKILARWRGI